MNIKKRYAALNLLLCVITLGIYSFYWIYTLTEDSNKICPEKATASGGKAVLLFIFTFGIYGYYWFYKLGRKIYEKNFKSGAMELFFYIIGLGIFAMFLTQTEVNLYAPKEYDLPRRRNCVLSTLLSIVTFGIYYIYWYLRITDESNCLATEENKLPYADTCYCLDVISLHYYNVYWAYKLSKTLKMRTGLCIFFSLFINLGNLIYAQRRINAYLTTQIA